MKSKILLNVILIQNEFNFNLIKSYFLFLSLSQFIFCNLRNVSNIFLLQLHLRIKDQKNFDANTIMIFGMKRVIQWILNCVLFSTFGIKKSLECTL